MLHEGVKINLPHNEASAGGITNAKSGSNQAMKQAWREEFSKAVFGLGEDTLKFGMDLSP